MGSMVAPTASTLAQPRSAEIQNSVNGSTNKAHDGPNGIGGGHNLIGGSGVQNSVGGGPNGIGGGPNWIGGDSYLLIFCSNSVVGGPNLD